MLWSLILFFMGALFAQEYQALPRLRIVLQSIIQKLIEVWQAPVVPSSSTPTQQEQQNSLVLIDYLRRFMNI